MNYLEKCQDRDVVRETNETSDLTIQMRQAICLKQVKLQRAHGGCLGTEKR